MPSYRSRDSGRSRPPRDRRIRDLAASAPVERGTIVNAQAPHGRLRMSTWIIAAQVLTLPAGRAGIGALGIKRPRPQFTSNHLLDCRPGAARASVFAPMTIFWPPVTDRPAAANS